MWRILENSVNSLLLNAALFCIFFFYFWSIYMCVFKICSCKSSVCFIQLSQVLQSFNFSINIFCILIFMYLLEDSVEKKYKAIMYSFKRYLFSNYYVPFIIPDIDYDEWNRKSLKYLFYNQGRYFYQILKITVHTLRESSAEDWPL